MGKLGSAGLAVPARPLSFEEPTVPKDGVAVAMQVLINFGSSWCTHCHKMFPAFVSLTKQVNLNYMAEVWGV